MLELHPQFVVDASGSRQAVVLSIAEYQHVIEALEEIDDIALFDDAETGDAVPWNDVRPEVGSEAADS